MHTASGVTVSVVLLADQHQKRSCLAEASTFFWTLGTEHLQQVIQNAQFQLVCGTSDCYSLPLQGEHLPVKTNIVCQFRGGSATPRITLTLNKRLPLIDRHMQLYFSRFSFSLLCNLPQ